MENRPLRTIYVHEQLRSKLCDLYENDAIFDKFQCSFSGDNQRIMTVCISPFLIPSNSIIVAPILCLERLRKRSINPAQRA